MSIESIYGTEVIHQATELAKQWRCPRAHFKFPIDPEVTDQRDAKGVEELARELAQRAGVAGFEHRDIDALPIDPDIERLSDAFPGSILLG